MSWVTERDKFLAEMIMLEGRGHAICQDLCVQCHIYKAEYRCLDCLRGDLYCKACVLSNHKCHPFHFIDVSSFITVQLI